MGDIQVSLDQVSFLGAGLQRPECVLATKQGALFVADWRGGVTRIAADGTQQSFLAKAGGGAIKPNGIALERDGAFLLANLGEEGGLFRLRCNGSLSALLQRVDGYDLPPSNFVMIDPLERIWLTVSTRQRPRDLGYRPDIDDGFIVVIDAKGARVVAEGLGYANEVQCDDTGTWLYANETFARRLSRFRIGPDASLSGKEVVTEFGHGCYPDGLAFDAEGGIWVTSIVSNRVIRVAPDGSQAIVLEDSDPAHLDWVEQAFQAGRLGRPHLDRVKSRKLKNISSLAFGGPDLRTVYLGCLLGERIASFRSPIPGRAPVHWAFTD